MNEEDFWKKAPDESRRSMFESDAQYKERMAKLDEYNKWRRQLFDELTEHKPFSIG